MFLSDIGGIFFGVSVSGYRYFDTIFRCYLKFDPTDSTELLPRFYCVEIQGRDDIWGFVFVVFNI